MLVGQTSPTPPALCPERLNPVFEKKTLAFPAPLSLFPTRGLPMDGGLFFPEPRSNPLTPGPYPFFTSGLRDRRTQWLCLPIPSLPLSEASLDFKARLSLPRDGLSPTRAI